MKLIKTQTASFFTVAMVLFMLVLNGCGQSEAPTTLHLKVAGNCEMCQERILTAAKAAGLPTATWTPESQTLVAEIPDNIQPGAVSKAIAAAGHDTELDASTDSTYAQLPECCQYERLPKRQVQALLLGK